MPQYELMYLLGSHVADTDVPAITEQAKKFIADFGGENIVEQQLGKKKLAYPIKKTRNGYYVVVSFAMDAKKINQLDARIRSMGQNIIRYLLVNLDEHLARVEKDKKVQAKLPRRTLPVAGAAAGELMQAPEPKVEKAAKPAPVLDLDSEALDKKIEEVLNEDLTK